MAMFFDDFGDDYAPYQSLFDYLSEKFEFIRELHERFNSDQPLDVPPYKRRWNFNPYLGQSIIGGLHPIADMGKDFVQSFMPYKSNDYIKRDLLQPIRGMGNIAKGVANLIGAPLVFFVNTARYTFHLLRPGYGHNVPSFLHNMGLQSRRSASWFLNGVSSIVRGITQVVTTPLTTFLRIPFRLIRTAIAGKPKIEQNSSIKRLVEKGNLICTAETVEHEKVIELHNVCLEMHYHFKKAISRGQSTNISSNKEQKLFADPDLRFKYGHSFLDLISDASKQAALNYLGLFSNTRAVEPKREESSALLRIS